MLTVFATSDLHGHLPFIYPCDILIIAGDVTPVDQSHEPAHQATWLKTKFEDYLKQIPAKHIIGIGGNHDFALEAYRELGPSLSWNYLHTGYVTIEGYTFYGNPYVPNLASWAFHANEEKEHAIWDGVLAETDVIISHGPPRGICDKVVYEHVGSEPFKDNLKRLKAKLIICGHIHEGFGSYDCRIGPGDNDFTDIMNVTYLDRNYDPTHSIVDVSEYFPNKS